jgi:predicted N-formylglutamate amidohydrolase
MIEIRNDQIRDPAGIDRWAGLLARELSGALSGLLPGAQGEARQHTPAAAPSGGRIA